MPVTLTANRAGVGGATFDRSRKFGIEMECCGAPPETVAAELTRAGVPCEAEDYNHNRTGHWKIVGDGSIRGEYPFELVSPPMHGEAALSEIRKVCAVLNALRVRVNRSTGLHVHHDAADLDLATLKAVATMWWKFEDVIQFFLPPSRRNNSYCAPAFPRAGVCGYLWTPGADVAQGWAQAMSLINRREDFNTFQRGGRYAAVNFNALFRHGTIEFRAHSGTTDASKIIAWVALTQWFITRSKRFGCRASTRLTGRWAEETRFFWKHIDWFNLEDEVVIKAKNTLSERFRAFKAAARGEAAPATPVNQVRAGRIVQGPEAALPEEGEAEPPRRNL
jgi:hypothetical protein